jgi:hypothetical protein
MQYKLITLYPKQKEIGIGTLSIDEKTKEAIFFSGHAKHDSFVLQSMQSATINSASADGFTLSGICPYGRPKNGAQIYILQKWFLCYIG